MRPRRRDEPPEVDPSGAGLPELRLPPEDPDWIAKQIAAADPDPWIDPAPQMSTAVLEAGLTRWVRSLAPWLTLRGDLAALTLCAPPAPCLQARDGQPLCGTAAAAAIACEVANRVEMDRNRLLTGLEIAAACTSCGSD